MMWGYQQRKCLMIPKFYIWQRAKSCSFLPSLQPFQLLLTGNSSLLWNLPKQNVIKEAELLLYMALGQGYQRKSYCLFPYSHIPIIHTDISWLSI